MGEPWSNKVEFSLITSCVFSSSPAGRPCKTARRRRHLAPRPRRAAGALENPVPWCPGGPPHPEPLHVLRPDSASRNVVLGVAKPRARVWMALRDPCRHCVQVRDDVTFIPHSARAQGAKPHSGVPAFCLTPCTLQLCTRSWARASPLAARAPPFPLPPHLFARVQHACPAPSFTQVSPTALAVCLRASADKIS